MEARPYQTSVFRAQPTEGLQRKIQKRNRPPVSCLLCRTRKVKCDRQQPCERCVKSGEAAFCEYAPRAARKPKHNDTRPAPDPRPKQETSTSRPLIQDRLQKLEDMVNGLLCSSSKSPENLLDTPSSSDHRGEGEALSDLATPPSTVASAPASGPYPPPADASYVGATHWSAILEGIHDLRGLVEAMSEDPPSPSPPPSTVSNAPNLDIVYGSHHRLTMEQAIARLPSRRKTDQLVFGYFTKGHASAPYIHTSKFQREYEQFWRDPSSVSLLWLSILASICNASASVSMAKGEDVSDNCEAAHPEKLAALATDCLVAGDYLAGKPYAIEALLLQSQLELYRRRGCDASLWAKFGLLVRLAQRMGYHRDPKYLPHLSPFEGELRRRVWFFIEVFDCLFSIQLGMPPIIREDECDTESPGNRFDLDFDEHTMVLPPPRPATEPTGTLYLCYKSKMCRLLRRVIRYSLAIQPAAYDDVLKLNEEIHAFRDQLPPTLRIRPVRAYSFTEQSFDIVHRLLLEMAYLKSLCVLHRAYINHEKDNPRYAISRSTCIDAALRILDLHVEYDTESKPGGRLYEDRFMLEMLTLHDFLIASMVVCLDLMESAKISPAERSRKIQALAASYKIWSAKKHISEDAAHATRIVGAILRKISLQEQQPMRTAAPIAPPPQPDVRGGSLASLLNNDTQPAPTMPSVQQQPPLDQWQLIHAMDFGLDFMEAVPLDAVLDDPSRYDWNLIDQYLMDRPAM